MTNEVSDAAAHIEVGRKRARNEETLKPANISTDEYLQQLLAEYARHQKLQGPNKMPHSERLVLAQIDAIRESSHTPSTQPDLSKIWNADQGDSIRTELASTDRGPGSNIKAHLKVFIPEDVAGDVRGSTTRGRLLGPKGATIQRMQDESGCKMQIRGKGSIKFKDGSSEESHMHEEQYAHLAEGLHVAVQYDGPLHLVDSKFRVALALIRTVVTGGTLSTAPYAHDPSGHYGGAGGGHWDSRGGMPHGGGMAGAAGGAWRVSSAAEVAAAQAASLQGEFVSVVTSNKEAGTHCSTVVKMFIPQKTAVGDSRGKLLGVKGATLRQLQSEAGVRMSLRGKGSGRVPEGEAAATGSSEKHAHLRDELHVLMEFEGPLSDRDLALNSASRLTRSVLTAADGTPPGQKHPLSQFEARQQHSHAPHLQTPPPLHLHPHSQPQQPFHPPTLPSPSPQYPPAPFPGAPRLQNPPALPPGHAPSSLPPSNLAPFAHSPYPPASAPAPPQQDYSHPHIHSPHPPPAMNPYYPSPSTAPQPSSYQQQPGPSSYQQQSYQQLSSYQQQPSYQQPSYQQQPSSPAYQPPHAYDGPPNHGHHLASGQPYFR